MQLALVEKALPYSAASQADEQSRAAFSQQLGSAAGKNQGYRIDAGEYGLGFAQRIQPGREGLNPGERGEQQLFITPAGWCAAQRDGCRQRRVVVVLTKSPPQQSVAVPALDIGKVFELEALFGDIRQQEKQVGPMLPEVGGECLQAHRFIGELALDLDVARTPAVRCEKGAIEQQNTLGSHQVFILVMMS